MMLNISARAGTGLWEGPIIVPRAGRLTMQALDAQPQSAVRYVQKG